MKRITKLFFMLAAAATGLGFFMLTHQQTIKRTHRAPFQQQTNLTQCAIDKGYGYKTANLMELSSLITTIKTPGITIAIPEFVGITDTEILSLLEKAGLFLHERWDELESRYFSTEQLQQKIIDEQTLPTGFLTDLAQLRSDIQAACAQQVLMPGITHLEAFLALSKNSNWQLMVRSTGQEDTDTLANAGGNLTECNINPETKTVLKAIGNVIASYFGKKSLMQRLQAGDDSIFSLPLTPVLLQRMIGEKHGCPSGEIPVGCVAYSREIEGNTPGVTTIQSSFGHNEGVVESTVALDTYYVDAQQNIFSSIKHKPRRMVPGEHGLTYANNPNNLVYKPTLTPPILRAIDNILRSVDLYYQKAMDLELVFQPRSKTVYLVQARPIVLSTQIRKPSYLKSIKECTTIPCIPVCSNSGQLQHITNQQQALTAQTLNAALDAYNNMGEQKQEVRAVIVAQEAEPTSHAAAVFRGEGKLVLKLVNTHNFSQLEQILSKRTVSLYADSQRHCLAQSHEKLASPRICNGWLNHPLPELLTVDSSIRATKPTVLYDKYPTSSYMKLLKIIKEAPAQKAQSALTSLLKKVDSRYKELSAAAVKYTSEGNGYLSYQAHLALEQLDILQHNLWHTATSLRATLKLPANNITRLFYLRFIKALLLQKPLSGYCNQYSVHSCTQQFYSTVEFFEKTIQPLLDKKQLSKTLLLDIAMMQQAYNGCNAALNKQVTRKWLTFLDKFRAHGTDEQHALFHKMLGQLKATKLLTCWLNASFIESYKRFSKEPVRTRTLKCFNRLKREFYQAQPLLATMQQHQQYQATLAPSLWQNPATFPEQLQRFNQNILSFFASNKFVKLLKSRNKNILQKACLSTMLLHTVETFDQLIKQMKGSTLYTSDETKNMHFKNALFMYLQLLKQFNLEPKLATALEHALHNAPLTDKKQLINSRDFNVNNVICLETMSQKESLDAKQREVSELIGTLEDLFTSIHQLLLLKISNQVVQRWKLNKTIAKPTLLTQAEKSLKLRMALTGIRFDNNAITYRYNKKLRAHSVSVELTYNIAQQDLVMNICFYGDNEYSRWHIIRDYVTSASQLKQLTLSGLAIHDTGLSFSWHIDANTPCTIIKECLEKSITTTLRLGIEHRKKMFLETRTILEKLSHHLELLAGGKQKLITHFVTQQQNLHDLNVLVLPLLTHFDTTQASHYKLVHIALEEAIDYTKPHLLDVLPVNFYLYQQAGILLEQDMYFDSTDLGALFCRLDKIKQDKRRQSRRRRSSSPILG